MAVNVSDEEIIRKVLTVDGFEILNLEFSNDTVSIIVKSTKFRSTAQAVCPAHRGLRLTTLNLLIFPFILRIYGQHTG